MQNKQLNRCIIRRYKEDTDLLWNLQAKKKTEKNKGVEAEINMKKERENGGNFTFIVEVHPLHHLLQAQIPPHQVQAIQIHNPLLWTRMD